MRSTLLLLAGVLSLSTFQPADAATANLVRNGSFEYNAQFWCKVGTTIVHQWTVTS